MLSLALGLAFLVHAPTLGQAATNDEYEEVSYESLLNQLSAKKPKAPTRNALDDTKIHAGIGYVGSTVGLRVDNQEFYRYQDGLQLSLGVDLFSPKWAAEGAFRNFGRTTTGTSAVSLREFDLKVFRQERGPAGWGYRLGGGLASRYMRYEDTARNTNISASTPSSIFFLGITSKLTDQVYFVAEASFRSSLVGDSIDRRGADIGSFLDIEF